MMATGASGAGNNNHAELYYDGTEVFTTMSGGVNVLGTAQCDQLSLDGSNGQQVSITAAGANTAYTLNLPATKERPPAA